jgi:glutamate-1-semialdehyde 2,1-aminomutase
LPISESISLPASITIVPTSDTRSRQAFDRGLRVFPGGTTRVTVEKKPIPCYVARGQGAWLEDVDGRTWLDLHGNFTTLIHGHAFPPVVEAVTRQLRDGTCFANPTLAEIALAELLCDRVAGLDRLRFVNTGSEAVMFAVKAARAFTGRPAIAKIEGAYHGSYDWVEVSQTSDATNWGPEEEPRSILYYTGTPASVADDVVTLRLNDAQGAARLIEKHAGRLAAVVLDAMPSRTGLIPVEAAFVETVVSTARRYGVLVISDEVMNFRLGYAGAAARAGFVPDLWTFGKIIGGGFPIGAIGGRSAVMSVFGAQGAAPAVPQGGTFSANPVSMVAGLASMQALTPDAYRDLEALGDTLRACLESSIETHKLPLSITGSASLLRVHGRATPPRDYRETVAGDRSVVARMVEHFASEGLLVPSSGMICLSTALNSTDIEHVATVFDAFASAEALRGGKA